MKPSDALDLVALVEDRWTSWRPNDEQRRRFAEDVADLDAAQVRAALDVLHREGGEFAPTAGALRRRVATLQLDPPPWLDVKRQLIDRHVALQSYEAPEWTCPAGKCDGTGWLEVAPPRGVEGGSWAGHCECWDARLDARRLADTLHPLVREFIDGRFVSWAEVEAVGEAAGTRDVVTLEAQMRTKWEAFAARAVESRAIANLPAGAELRRLEAARDEDGPRRLPERGELKRLDPLAGLPAAAER